MLFTIIIVICTLLAVVGWFYYHKNDYIFVVKVKKLNKTISKLKKIPAYDTNKKLIKNALSLIEKINDARENGETIIISNGVLGIIKSNYCLEVIDNEIIMYKEANSNVLN